MFTIEVTDVGEARIGPVTDVNLADNMVSEDATAGALGGLTATAVDADEADTVSYSVNDDRFVIDGSGVVRVAEGAAFRYGDEPEITLKITATSSDGSSSDETFTIAVADTDQGGVGSIADVDDATNAVDEDAGAGDLVGIMVAAADPDAGDTVTFAVDDARFTVSPAGVVAVADGA